MINVITLLCLFGMVTFPSIANILAYPFCPKLSMKISNYIVKVLAPRVFAICNTYKNFKFWAYKDNFDKLPEQFMIITNHQSLLDIPAVMNFMRDVELRFVSKDTLGRHIPLVSEMLRTQQHCLVPRKAKPMDAMRYIEEFGYRVAEKNQIPVLFPEGSRSKDGNVGKFYTAGFRKLAESSKLPVVVCALDGGFRLRDLSKVFINLNNGCYRVKIVKIYDCPQTKEECNMILDESRELIQKQIDEWRKLPNLQK